MINPFKRFGTTKTIIGGVVVILILFLIYHFTFGKSSTTYQFVTVTQGSITEEVSVTGNTTPLQSLDLAFQNGGTIAAVNYPVGSHVNQGDVIARLNTSALQAQLAQAQANVSAAQAQLASLQAGSQPADIQASQAALAGGQQSLVNMYSNVSNTLSDSYSKANDAVRNQLTTFFTNPESSNPQLTFTTNNNQTVNSVQFDRVSASVELNAWQSELTSLNSFSASSSLDSALQNGANHISIIKKLLADASQSLLQQTGLSATTLAAYNADLNTATNEVNTAATNINTAAQNIASQKITIQQLQAQLNLKLAGSTAQQIANQQAQVEAAQANVQSVQVSINQASLVSPISGVITVQNAKVGQIASPGVTVVSLISDNNFEVDSEVPETDIGKVSVGQAVTMTIDAFPGETFTGKVFYIDPAQTDISGVVNYTVKVSFDKADSRIKSGLTVNLDIQTQTDNNALILPQYAVTQNDQGAFVDVLQNDKDVQVPVTLGIQDQNGNVEILSGVTAGEKVINIGIKQGS